MDDSRRTRIEPTGGMPNAGTLVFAGGLSPRLATSAIATAWSSLVPALSLIPPREPDRVGYRIFWTGCGEMGFRDFACAEAAHLVVGRHSMADVVLARDAELSLRHLLVIPTKTGVRLVDLRAAVPMLLDDDTAQRSLHAEGPFAVRLGRYVLGGFPIGPGQGSPPLDLPRPARVDATRPGPLPTDHDEPGDGGPYRDAPPRRRSVITLLPRPITMADSVGRAPEGAIGLLGAARDGERVRIPVREIELRAGVLVGRAEKCTDGGLRPLLTSVVSRVHAMVVEVEGRTMLYDCASTNGTYVDGRRVRGLELGADGPVVHLANSQGIALRWTRIRHGGP